jgi:excisionase family DNA binding protein
VLPIDILIGATWTYRHQLAATRIVGYNPGVKQRSDQVFDVDELSEYLKLPKSTVYKLAQEGRIPAQKAGRHWRFLKRAIDDWLERGDRGNLDSPSSGG